MNPVITDQELDALARDATAPPAPGEARLEQMRTGLLAAAADVTPRPARVLRARTIALAVPFAAAAVIALWLVARRGEDSAPRSRAQLTPAADAELAQIGSPPDEIVHLRSGSLATDVAPLRHGERFRVITSDAEIEVRSARFVVAADHGRLATVEVIRGELELRPRDGARVTLRAGERWAAPPAEVAMATPPPPSDVVAVVPAPEATASPAKVRDRGKLAKKAADPRDETPNTSEPPTRSTAPATSAKTAPAPAPAPGEAEFRTGWEALRAGDATRAAASFEASRRAAGGGAIAEDARFWEGVALARAGKSTEAIAALRRFLDAHPKSARAGEASGRLGWLLVDAGQLDAAEAAFRAASTDRVPAVRRSASKGLDKVRALRSR